MRGGPLVRTNLLPQNPPRHRSPSSTQEKTGVRAVVKAAFALCATGLRVWPGLGDKGRTVDSRFVYQPSHQRLDSYHNPGLLLDGLAC